MKVFGNGESGRHCRRIWMATAVVTIAATAVQGVPGTLLGPGASVNQFRALSCGVPHQSRADCGFLGVSKDECERNGCCWDPTEAVGIPWCFHRDSRACSGYAATDVQDTKQGYSAKLQLRGGCRLYGPDVRELALTVDYETDTRVHIKITDANKQRYEVPESVFPRPAKSRDTDKDSAMYEVRVSQEMFSFKVVRKSDGETIFDTTLPGGSTMMNPLIFEEQFIEISTRLPKEPNIFGLGEVIHALRRDPTNTRQTMWARDAATPKDQNIYGTHPFHIEMRNGKAHGVFLLNSNGMDVFLRPESLSYKVIGGVLDFYIFVGPSPADVVHQYYEVIGHPHMIPYWVLGFHHCRYGYKNLNEVKEVVRKYREANIPLETMWTDIDYMDAYKDFTLDPVNFPENEMKAFVSDLHQKKQKYVLIIDPAIKVENGYEPYEEGLQKGLFIKNRDGSPLIGKVWPGLTAFPDFLNPQTQSYWTKWIRKFMEMVPIDGLWIDMNEPANFCDGNCLTEKEEPTQVRLGYDATTLEDKDGMDPMNPIYKINNGGYEAPLQSKTVSPDTMHYNNTLHYDVHNLYGHTEAIMTRKALLDIQPTKRPFILSRSSFPGTGVHSGHWTGDNWSTWEHLYFSIPSMISFQFFGIPLVGADICGFIGNVAEELCARWMQLGAFYPFSRNHNTIDAAPQEPYLWDSVARASRNALAVRYAMLPYYYTLFYQAHKFGATVVRPLFFEFPDDKNAVFYDRQFLVGGGVLVTPVLDEHAREVETYFADGLWYDWYTHRLAANVSSNQHQGTWTKLAAPLDHINVHIRGGFIIPTQIPAMTTYEARQNDFELIVATGTHGRASGNLYIDDGESFPLPAQRSYIHFALEPIENGAQLTADGVFGYETVARLDTVFFLGVQHPPKTVTVNDVEVDKESWSYDSLKNELTVRKMKIAFSQRFVIRWRH